MKSHLTYLVYTDLLEFTFLCKKLLNFQIHQVFCNSIKDIENFGLKYLKMKKPINHFFAI